MDLFCGTGATVTPIDKEAHTVTTREHLKAVHTRLAEHHIEKAKHHGAMHEHHSRLAEHFGKMDGHDETADCHREMAEAHKAMTSEHTDMAEMHTQHAKDLSASHKAAGMTDDVIPDRVSGIVTHFAVPRHGAPALDKASVPQEFRHLVETE